MYFDQIFAKLDVELIINVQESDETIVTFQLNANIEVMRVKKCDTNHEYDL